ncbi:MAG: T9SS type A sorting domain-containing protein [Bacteroidia bacterium]|nr:T9SS type A sorting domain-containing protein [Bacteroidia bacterium]
MTFFKWFISVLCLAFSPAYAQYSTVGTGNFAGTVAGPLRLSTVDSNYYSRYTYIYPEALLSDLKHGDTITRFELATQAGYAPDGNTLLEVYAENTSLIDFTGQSEAWNDLIATSKLVYSGSLLNVLKGNTGFNAFDVNNNFWVYDTSKGKNILLSFDFVQKDTQGGVISFDYDNTNVFSYATNSTRYYFGNTKSDSLKNSAQYHPQLILNYPRKDKEIALLAAYSLGKLPVPLGNPDSIRILIRNTGKKNLSQHELYLKIRGANTINDTSLINLTAAGQTFLTLKPVNVSKFGLDSILIHSDIGMQGQDSVWTFRNNNFNVYSYENPIAPGNSGGIGFNGSTGDFVARFFSNTAKTINQITVSFGQGGRPFRIGVWDDSRGGLPGKLLWESDSLTSVNGKYILDLKTPLKVSGTFFTGVRQLSTTNVAFGYQPENPVRPNTFLYAFPKGDTTWIDFAPNSPFRFLIEPRIQADTDLVVSQIILPSDTFNTSVDTSFYPECVVKNIGVHDVTTPFKVRCIMQYFGTVFYDETVTDTLYSGGSKSIVFNKKILPFIKGMNQVQFIVSHPSDQVNDNDTMGKTMFVGLTKDVGFNTVYEPLDNIILKHQIDTIGPLCVFGNYGFEQTPTFNIRCEMKRGDTVLYNETITSSFAPNETRFLIFPTYRCTDTGRLKVRFISEMPGDIYLPNDTVVKNVRILRLRDLVMLEEGIPTSSSFYTPNVPFVPQGKIQNQGLIEEFDSELRLEINTVYSNQTYNDTVLYDARADEIKTVPLKSFVPHKKGIYQAVFITKHPDDEYPENDSLSYTFNVGHPYDYKVNSIDFPEDNETFTKSPGAFLAPKATFKNEGFNSPPGLVPIICEIWKNSTRVYYDIKSTNLDTSELLPITFPNTFDLGQAGKYTMRCMTNFNADLNRPNDTLEIEFTVKIGEDAQVVSIDSPSTAYARISKQIYKASVQNNGFNAMNNLTLVLEKNGLFEDSISLNLEPYEEKKVTFTKTYTPQNPGFDMIKVYFAFEPDLDVANDTFTKIVSVQKKYDGEIRMNNAFCAGVYTANEDSSNVTVFVENFGIDTIKSGAVKIDVVEPAQARTVFSEIIEFTNLPPSGSEMLASSKNIHFNAVTQYEIYANLMPDTSDLFPKNDSTGCAITVNVNSIQPRWAQAIKIHPNPTSNLIQFDHLPEGCIVSLWNAHGQRIKNNISGDYNVSKMSAGIYLIRVLHQRQFATFKLIVE